MTFFIKQLIGMLLRACSSLFSLLVMINSSHFSEAACLSFSSTLKTKYLTKANFTSTPLVIACRDFVFWLFCDQNPLDTSIESKGPTLFDKWLFFQLAPLITLALPKLFNFLEDLLLHSIPLPPFLGKSSYKKLYNAFYVSVSSTLDEAEQCGIKRNEACHNLVFMASFNAYGGSGMKTLFPALIKWLGLAGEKLHRRLCDEIRTIVRAEGGVTESSLDKMTLTKLVVYKALGIEPPVPFQYGKGVRQRKIW